MPRSIINEREDVVSTETGGHALKDEDLRAVKEEKKKKTYFSKLTIEHD